MTTSRQHWEDVWADKPEDEMSWHQETPTRALELIRSVTTPEAHVVDVGGGASTLVADLAEEGYDRPTLVDLSSAALERARLRLGPRAQGVTFLRADVTELELDRPADCWHDRAVLHFLTDPSDRRRYADRARANVPVGGHAVISVFADPDGPESCSGLPVRRYDADALAELLGGFTLQHDEREEHVTPSGSTQVFTTAVLRRDG